MKVVCACLAMVLCWPIFALAETGPELFAAAAGGQVERVETLLAQGADVNAKNAAERTPLMVAAGAGNTRIVRKLLGFGADPNLADKRGITALMEAASNGNLEVVKMLVAAGADLNAKDAAGALLLDRVRKAAQPGILAFLEESGAKGVPKETPTPPPAADGEKKPEEAAGKEGESKSEAEKKN
jgi:ankyrin repeat protein